MAYLGAFHRFLCDWCQKVVDAEKSSGWHWIKSGMGQNVRHACPNCLDKVEDKKSIRKPGEKN